MSCVFCHKPCSSLLVCNTWRAIWKKSTWQSDELISIQCKFPELDILEVEWNTGNLIVDSQLLLHPDFIVVPHGQNSEGMYSIITNVYGNSTVTRCTPVISCPSGEEHAWSRAMNLTVGESWQQCRAHTSLRSSVGPGSPLTRRCPSTNGSENSMKVNVSGISEEQ